MGLPPIWILRVLRNTCINAYQSSGCRLKQLNKETQASAYETNSCSSSYQDIKWTCLKHLYNVLHLAMTHRWWPKARLLNRRVQPFGSPSSPQQTSKRSTFVCCRPYIDLLISLLHPGARPRLGACLRAPRGQDFLHEMPLGRARRKDVDVSLCGVI